MVEGHNERICKFVSICASVIVILLLYSTSAGGNNVESEAWLALEMWEPLSIEQNGSSLVVTAKERSVSQTIYTAMIGYGICLYIVTGEIKLAGISEIVVLNRFGASGWVFEGGQSSCTQMANVPASKLDLLILGQTHMYSCSSGRDCKFDHR